MSENQIANRYARALFRFAEGDLAVAQSHHQALGAIDELFENPESGKILRSPIMPVDLKKELLDILNIQLSDNVKACEIDEHLNNNRIVTKGPDIRAQMATYEYFKNKYSIPHL